MAFLTPGPLGRPGGKIGNIVYYMLKGKVVCRSIGKHTKKPTLKQLANRQAMRVTMNLLKPMQRFIKHGFEHKAIGTVCNAFNLATSYNKSNALQGEYPNISVDYAKVVLSSGDLPLAADMQISKTAGGLLLKWNPEKLEKGDQHDDLVMVALYYPGSQGATAYMNAGKRSIGECFIRVSKTLLDEPTEAYACFKSADGPGISDSLYLGNINGHAESEEEKEINEKYNATKTRFEVLKKQFKPNENDEERAVKESKATRHLRKEYEILKEKLKNMPGKPV